MSELDDSSRPKSAYFVRRQVQSSQTKSPVATTIVLNIAGTRPSIQNNQLLLTPIGIPSIDYFLGGGLPVGSVCLIGQDRNGTYSDLINRCFLAEGVSHKHSLYVADLYENVDRLFQISLTIKRIPTINKVEDTENVKSEENLRIAWRYSQQQQQPLQQQQAQKILQPNYFRTDRLMNKEEIYAQCNVKSFSKVDNEKTDCIYAKLANHLSDHIDNQDLNVLKTKTYTNLARIVLNSLGSLVYNDACTLDDEKSTDLCKFLLKLRRLMRHSLAVCIVTVPNDVATNRDLVEKFSHLCDYYFSLDDSIVTVSHISHTEYDGLFRLEKLPRLNSLNACFTPATLDLAFFYRKKRLVVEQMHLPPDLAENDEAHKGRTNTSMSCSSSSATSSGLTSKSLLEKTSYNKKLDF